jgi:uncharacterized beta-barrel protein YwiB (DUF1934 family)
MCTEIVDTEGAVESHLHESVGDLIETGGNFYLRYHEKEGASVVLKIGGSGEVDLTRQGEHKTKLRFVSGAEVESQIATIYGVMNLWCAAERVDVRIVRAPEFSACIEIDYRLKSLDSELGKYRLRVSFK